MKTIKVLIILTMILSILKLTTIINWNWVWVLAPIGLPITLFFIFVCFAGIISLLFANPEHKKE